MKKTINIDIEVCDIKHGYNTEDILSINIDGKTYECPSDKKFTGMYDRDNRPVFNGDILGFDEDEWGGTPIPMEKIIIDDMIGEWPYCGCKSDVANWRRVVDD